MSDTEKVIDKYQRHRKTRARLTSGNKTVLFDALEAAGITSVFVAFDGQGDSGQIDDVRAYRGDTVTAFPDVTISIRQVSWRESKLHKVDCKLPEAIEALCYDYLAEDHDGWENNDGAYGEFNFDVAKRTVKLEFNERYVDTHTSFRDF